MSSACIFYEIQCIENSWLRRVTDFNKIHDCAVTYPTIELNFYYAVMCGSNTARKTIITMSMLLFWYFSYSLYVFLATDTFCLRFT